MKEGCTQSSLTEVNTGQSEQKQKKLKVEDPDRQKTIIDQI